MNDSTFNTATTNRNEVAKIVAMQTKNATSGARVHIRVTKPDGEVLVSTDEISGAIGNTAYNTICSAALTSLNTALSSAKSTKDTAFGNL